MDRWTLADMCRHQTAWPRAPESVPVPRYLTGLCVCVCVCVSEFQRLKGAYKEMIFKPAVLTWKCLHDSAPRHLAHRPLCAGGVYERSSPVSLCSLRGPPGALDSDVYWPAQLCRVWLHDLESTTNGPPITRTVTRFIQVPAQDPLVCSSTRQWVSCTVVPSALL